MSALREFGESAARAVLERVGRGVSRVQERTPLSYDLLESGDAYRVVFDAPGATRSDVQVRFVDGEVQVRIDRFREFHEGFEMRFPGRGLSLDGRATLPEHADVDTERASAVLTDHGTLEVNLPKTDADEVDEADDADDGEATEDGPAVGRESDDAVDGDATASDAGESDDAT